MDEIARVEYSNNKDLAEADICEGPATTNLKDASSEKSTLHYQLGNPVFSATFTHISYDDPRNEEQGDWYKSESLLYKTSSGSIGKYPLRASNMPVSYHGKNGRFSEAAIATGPPRHNGFNTSVDKSRTMAIDAYSTVYVKRL